MHTATAPLEVRATTTPDVTDRAAGFGALGFAGIVVVQNLVRSGAPQPGDDITDVLAYFADHRATSVALLGTFVASLCCLVVFLGGALRRLTRTGHRGWAILGGVGAVGIIAQFAVVVAAEQALSVLANGANPDLGAAEAVWAFHNSAFTVNLLFIGIALVGLSRAGIADGITPTVFRRLAPAAAAVLALGTFAGPYVAAGDAMPIFGVSVLGFLVWLAFLATTGLRLVRTEAS